VLDNIIVFNDCDLLLGNARAMHGPLYTIEDPAGTGKSYAILAHAIIDLDGDNFNFYTQSGHPRERIVLTVHQQAQVQPGKPRIMQ
jgi:hypothetical protein